MKRGEGWGDDGVVNVMGGFCWVFIYSWEKIRWRWVVGPCDYGEEEKKNGRH